MKLSLLCEDCTNILPCNVREITAEVQRNWGGGGGEFVNLLLLGESKDRMSTPFSLNIFKSSLNLNVEWHTVNRRIILHVQN
jgi:hypothetical protein